MRPNFFALDHYAARVVLYHVFATVVLTLCVTSVNGGSNARVQHAQTFALGGVGEAGVMSDGEKALRAVMAEPDAASQLENLYPHATDAGRLYLLVGLRMRDRDAYHRVLALCSGHESVVETMRGCIVDRESFHSLVRQIDNGEFDRFLKRAPQ